MPKKVLKQMALSLIEDNLKKYFNVTFSTATEEQIFKAIAAVTADELLEVRKHSKRVSGSTKIPIKTLNYLSIEFLQGRTLKNTLFNLGWEQIFAEVLKSKGIDINKIYDIEADAGLGTGGLGRLAACYMDSLATQKYPAMTHCIKYEYGLFKQRIIDGQQVELLDEWLNSGSIWLTARPDEAVTVRFGGRVYSYPENGRLKFIYENAQEVEAIPYDMLLSGYSSDLVTTLRLWSAKSKLPSDATRGTLTEFLNEANEVERINSILYPSEDHIYGRTLRLKQHYFLCSAAIQSIVNFHVRKKYDLKNLSLYTAIHINDTHPALSIPELMRVLLDNYAFSWDDACDVVTKCMSYTNHTIMSEAAEVWEADLIEKHIPRIYQILCEIDRRFREFLKHKRKDPSVIESMAVISNNSIRMANLSIMASHKVNGVSKIHSDILKDKQYKNFAHTFPEKFINITNGVTHRRWLAESNPGLCDFITSHVGNKFYTDANCLKLLAPLKDDTVALEMINRIKYDNKKAFAKWLFKYQGVFVNPNSRFDVHIKRIHEYKRQLLNVLRIIWLYNELKKNPKADIVPQTFIFAGKAASSYYMAKRIIKLITHVAAAIDKDEAVNKILKVVFIENFSVTVSENLIPAEEVTQQVSLVGQEASGTGNMKSVMNGAIMMCTYDGANAEIVDMTGESNFVFGLRSVADVENVWRDGYNPIDIYNSDRRIMEIIDSLNTGFNGESFKDIASYLLGTASNNDNYMCLADLGDYIAAHEKMDALYRKPMDWAKAVLKNISAMGYFSSDRAVADYIRDVWHITKLK